MGALQRKVTSLATVTGAPSKGGTLALRKAAAMQPPMVVPW